MSEQDIAKVGPEGRVLIPASIRRAAGIEPGMTIVLRVEGDHLVIMTRDAIRERLQSLFATIEGSLSEELIAERREEARREADGM